MPIAMSSPLKHTLLACFILLLAMSCLSVLIDSLVSPLIENTSDLAQFRQQLFLINVFVVIVFFIGFFLYKKNHVSSLKNIETHTKTEESITQVEPEKNSKENLIDLNLPSLLIVDDNPANVLIIEALLKSKNVNIESVSSGKDAINLYKQKSFDMIFMDIEMDDMDGFKTTENIRLLQQDQIRTPIIAVSAHTETEKRAQALLGGFDDYIVKPINDKRLSQALDRWLHFNTQENQIEQDNRATASQKHQLSPLLESQEETTLSEKEAYKNTAINKVVSIEKSLEYSHQNKKLAKDMLDLLISMVKEEKDNIQNLYQQKDWEELYHLIHKLYGGSCYCGVPDLQRASQQVENLLQKQNYQELDEAMSNLFNAIGDIISWDNQYDASIVFNLDDH